MHRRLFNSYLTAFSISTAVHLAANAEEDVNRPALNVGDRWLFRTTDGFTGLETRRVEWLIVELNESGLPRITLMVNGVPVTSATPNKDFVKTWPPAGFRTESGSYTPLDFPLYVGKQWSSEFGVRWLTDVTQIVPYRRKANVEAWETIHVPAGEFRTVRVVHEGTARVHMRDGEFNVPTRDVFWYSPDAKHYVKREIRFMQSGMGGIQIHTVEELLEYKVN
jgi:hypothetical protein